MDRPPGVAEVALQLSEDRGDCIGRERGAAGRVEAVDRLHESHACDLHQVVEGLVLALVATRELARQGQEPLDQLLAGRRVARLVVANQETPILTRAAAGRPPALGGGLALLPRPGL